MGFLLQKLASLVVYPLSISLGLGALALLLGARGHRRIAAAMAVASLAVGWGFSTPWVAHGLVSSLESQHPPVPVVQSPEADAIVVLGDAVVVPEPPRNAVELAASSDRLLHALRLYRAGKATRIVLSGGSVPWDHAPLRPADAMAELLVEWGVPKTALLLEDRSRNTYENLLFTRALLGAHGLERVLLVTSATHMPRALAVARSVGVDAIPSATDYRAESVDPWLPLTWLPQAGDLSLSTQAIKEYVGAAVYRFRGWIDESAVSTEARPPGGS